MYIQCVIHLFLNIIVWYCDNFIQFIHCDFPQKLWLWYHTKFSKNGLSKKITSYVIFSHIHHCQSFYKLFKQLKDMLYFWITNASRAHRAGRNEGSGKSTPVSVSGKGNVRRGRKKELSESPSKSCSETQLDKILQKNTPTSSLNASNSQVTMMSNGSADVPWMKSRSRGFSSVSSSTNSNSPNAHAIEKHKLYTRKTSSASLW